MILNKGKKEIDTNFEKTQSFRIAGNSKMFEILSSKLYSDPIAAIVRELSTNAVDSHIQAGKEGVPFEVHLPTLLEPWFSVMDFGVGMSHEEILQVYTVYGESPKDSSNLYNGALGLGSKSPFGYTQEFTVVSIKDKTKNTYLCYINNGFPDISLISSEETEEGNGVTVQVPVTEKDHKRFFATATRIYSFFKVRPKTNIATKWFTLKELTPTISILKGSAELLRDEPAPSSNMFGIHPKQFFEGHHRESSIYVLQSNVAYPIAHRHYDMIFKDKSDQSLGRTLEIILQSADNNSCHGNERTVFVLKVNNGDVSFTPNREELSFDEPTVNTIKKLLIEFKDQHVDMIRKDLDNTSSLNEFMRTHWGFLRAVAYNDSKFLPNLFESSQKYKKLHIDSNGAPTLLTDYQFEDISRIFGNRGVCGRRIPWVMLFNQDYTQLTSQEIQYRHSWGWDGVPSAAQIEQSHKDKEFRYESELHLNYHFWNQKGNTCVVTVENLQLQMDFLKSKVAKFTNTQKFTDQLGKKYIQFLFVEPAYLEALQKNTAFESLFDSMDYLDFETFKTKVLTVKKELEPKKAPRVRNAPLKLEERVVCRRYRKPDTWGDDAFTVVEFTESIGKVVVIGDSNSKYLRFTDHAGKVQFYGLHEYERLAEMYDDVYVMPQSSFNLATKAGHKFLDIEDDPTKDVNEHYGKPEVQEAYYCFRKLFKDGGNKKHNVKFAISQIKGLKIEATLEFIVNNWFMMHRLLKAEKTKLLPKSTYKGTYYLLGENELHFSGTNNLDAFKQLIQTLEQVTTQENKV